MGFLGNITKGFSSVQKKANDGFKNLVDSTLRTLSRNYFNNQSLLYPRYTYGSEKLYEFSYSSDILTIIHKSLRTEVFRNGYDLEEAENTDETITTAAEEVTAKGKTREEILDFLEHCNDNGQNILDVCKEIEDDLNIVDDGYMIFNFDYGINSQGEIETKELREVVRGDPRYMGMIVNKYDQPGMNDDGVSLNVCPEHREELIEGDKPCRCGKKAYKAAFFGLRGTTKFYYMKNEVIHRSKFRPSKTYGASPVITCWQKARTLLYMDKYIMDLYTNQRPPKAGLFFKTSNVEALEKSWESAQQGAQENPHLPIVMGINDTSSGGEFVKFLDFMKPLDELQHTEMRDEYRRQLGALYGVMPIFEADTSTSGGLNNEGLQVTVTNRAVSDDQYIFNTFFFPVLLKNMGTEGWSLTLQPSEEQDEMAKLQRQNQTLMNGSLAANLGLEVEYSDDTGEVIIKSGKIEKPEVSSPFSYFGNNDNNNDPTGTVEKSIKKALMPIKDNKKFEKVIREELDKFMSYFDEKPTELELQRAMQDIKNNLQNNINANLYDVFASIYKDQMKAVENELGLSFGFGQPDKNAIDLLMQDKFLQEALGKFTNDISTSISEIIEDAYKNPEGLNIPDLQLKIKEVGDFSDARAETIARVQTSKVSSAARKVSYQKSPEFKNYKFYHIGPQDARTTGTSARIKARTKNGVLWDEYVKIVTEESAKDYPTWTVDPNAPVSHWNSRHTFVRKVS